MSDRRELTAAVLGAAAAGGLALMAGGQRWAAVTVERPAPLPPVEAVMTGAAVAPLVPAAGLVLLAASVALFAVRSARVVVGLLIGLAGGVLGWAGFRALTGGLDAAAVAESGGGPGAASVELSAGWPVLAVVAGAAGLAAGLLVVLRGRRWPGMGRRYERPDAAAARPAARPRTDEERAQAAWQALDRGEDPTVEPADRRPGVSG